MTTGTRRPLVLLESPFAGDVGRNLAYARDAMRDSFARGEYPFASHLLYPAVLDDDLPAERTLGIEAGLAWGANAVASVVYADLGYSRGMRLGMERAAAERRPIYIRRIGWGRS